ncbi:hypothetical protein EBZ37_04670 [bacterium]|nr:hypothetical protein [bacterium]
MCPIHETDSASERWSKAEWEHYELWEKIEARARRIRRLWLAAGVLCFLVLSAVPVIKDRKFQWKAFSAARHFAQHLTALKREAGGRQQAFRLKIDPTKPLSLTVSWGPTCSSPLFFSAGSIELLSADSVRDELIWIDSRRGKGFGIAGLLEEFCYDPVHGSQQTQREQDFAAFMISPVKDLSPDRFGSVLLSGPSAEISFE